MSYIEMQPPGWMTIQNVQALQKIAFGMRRTDFTVLDIGSFLGRSTLQWFLPYKQAKQNGLNPTPPEVVCMDTFNYDYIPLEAREDLKKVGYSINWEGSMREDFEKNIKEFRKYITIVKGRYPDQHRLPPSSRFDVIFIDTPPIGSVLLEILQAVKIHCIGYRTLICGPHYTDTYAPEIVTEVNTFCNKIRGRFEWFPSSNLWGIRVQAD